MHQTNWLLPSEVKHAFLIVAADRQQKNALAAHTCVSASQSPLTGSCSGVQSKTERNCRVPNGVFMSRESVLWAARLLLCAPPAVLLAPQFETLYTAVESRVLSRVLLLASAVV